MKSNIKELEVVFEVVNPKITGEYDLNSSNKIQLEVLNGNVFNVSVNPNDEDKA